MAHVDINNYMTAPIIRITAVPRQMHQNSGLQAMFFAKHYADEVWALPATGDYIGDYRNVRFSALDTERWKSMLGVRIVRIAFMGWIAWRALFLQKEMYLVHSFTFALPLWLLRRGYCIFIHGTDRRFLNTLWGKVVARRAQAVYGIGFSADEDGVVVHELPNIFVPANSDEPAEQRYDVLFVTRNAPVKNPLYPLQLACQLGKSHRLRIAVAGVAPHELPETSQEELKALRDAGVDIAYLGRCTHDEVMHLMKSGLVLMLPSLSEGIPKAVLEAMHAGMHVVINRDLQLPVEIIDHVESVSLDDWLQISSVINVSRKNGRNMRNVDFAQRYLNNSQMALLAIYDSIYERIRAVR